jgi:hypothetical protein
VFEHLLVLAKVWPELVRVHDGDRRAMFRPVLETLFRFSGLPAVRLFVVHLRALVDAEVRFLKFRELDVRSVGRFALRMVVPGGARTSKGRAS